MSKDRKVTLKSKHMTKDDKGFIVLFKNIKPVGMVYTIVSEPEYEDDKNPIILLPAIDEKNLKLAVQYMNLRGGDPPNLIQKPRPIRDLEELKRLIDKKDYDFISGKDLTMLVELINAANYLNMKGLIQLISVMLAYKIAISTKGGDIEGLKKSLGFKSNFSEKEIKRIRHDYFKGKRRKLEILEPIIEKKRVRKVTKLESAFIRVASDLIIHEILPFTNVTISSNDRITYSLFAYIPNYPLIREKGKQPRREIFFLGQNLTILDLLELVRVPAKKIKHLSLVNTTPLGKWGLDLDHLSIEFDRVEVEKLYSEEGKWEVELEDLLDVVSSNILTLDGLELNGSTYVIMDKEGVIFSKLYLFSEEKRESLALKTMTIKNDHFIKESYKKDFKDYIWKDLPKLEELTLMNLLQFEDQFFQKQKLEQLKYLHVANLPRWDGVILFDDGKIADPFGIHKNTFLNLTTLILKHLDRLSDSFFQVSRFNQLEILVLEDIQNISGIKWSYEKVLYEAQEKEKEEKKKMKKIVQSFIGQSVLDLEKDEAYDRNFKKNLLKLRILILRDLPFFEDYFFMGKYAWSHLEEITLDTIPMFTGTPKGRSFPKLKRLTLDHLDGFQGKDFFSNHKNDFKNLEKITIAMKTLKDIQEPRMGLEVLRKIVPEEKIEIKTSFIDF